MLLFILVLTIGLQARLSPDDRAVLAGLRQAVSKLERRTISPQQFEQLAPKSNTATWQRLQRRLSDRHLGAADLAFVLAYYGVDYRRNLQRLLIPYRRLFHSSAEYPAWLYDQDLEVVLFLPDNLERLYQKHRDDYSLATLLDLRLDGGPAEARSVVLAQLWGHHAVRMLRLAARSTVRVKNIAASLDAESNDSLDRPVVVKELQRFRQHPDRRVAQAARRVLSLLKRRSDRSSRERHLAIRHPLVSAS